MSKIMRSKILAAVAVTLATLVAVPAFAAPEKAPARSGAQVARALHARADARSHRADGERQKPTFPIPAATFKQKTDARLAKAREHMEKRAAKLGADEAKALRAKFDAGSAAVNQEVAKAIADGSVTKEEAKSVFKAMRELRGKRGHGHGQGHGQGGKHARANRAAK
jgi:hypothetical protein